MDVSPSEKRVNSGRLSLSDISVLPISWLLPIYSVALQAKLHSFVSKIL